mmetsp:Transcript_254/g.480  ORF Transcript_254/g.480 Transcript_254/m.480 type:complete len:540 (+) Transcript_254:186-1805(+)|eukprot:CAMPEP_0183727104 /NCGR_PEP_ID=MMETSP0737-20130205/24853_1 /TAXON_ID=385413 /ORGANISM="Thalassiosira miniscula, Strain CCMP1093" /LENGTH=539 /DNA_ID=CAMNT_0025958649 /DNA_START=170 /DNA_END=1789 /DNA_ORIENTATION=-
MSASSSFRSPRRWNTATEHLPEVEIKNQQARHRKHVLKQPTLLGGVVQTPAWQPFLFSTVAPTMAAPFTNPFGVARTMLQNQSTKHKLFTGALDYFRKGFALEGWTALERGIAPVLMREASMNLFRIGLYQPCLDQIHDVKVDGKDAPISKRMAAGAVAGAIGAIACNPFEILRVRQQVQPIQTNSNNVLSTRKVYSDIMKEEGFKTLYRATGTSVVLGMVCTAVNMSTYTIFRERAHHGFGFKDGVAVDVGCALASGFLSALAMNPIDVVRTRMISDRSSPPKFRNGLHAARVLLEKEGPSAFMKGFVPSFLRIGPHFVITFMVLEQLRRVAHKYNSGKAERECYEGIFRLMDADGSGDISREELRDALFEAWPTLDIGDAMKLKEEREKVLKLEEEIFTMADTDNSGTIDLDEFLSAAKSKHLDKLLKGQQLLAIFRSFDLDGSGAIDEGELYEALRRIRHPCTGKDGQGDTDASFLGSPADIQLRADVSQIMRTVDKDGDGEIEFTEFASAVGELDNLMQKRFLEDMLQGSGVASG